MEISETSQLIKSNYEKSGRHHFTSGLSICFAIICIVDVFGVFPIITLPRSIINCGFAGILVIVTVCGIQIYTAILLGRCWLIAENIDSSIETKNRYPYSALAELTYGRNVSKCVTFLLDVAIFGAGIPNLIVASQNLQLLGLRVTDNSFNMSFCYWIILIGTVLCPLLWLGSPKDMKLICTLSVSMVLTVFILVWVCMVFDFTPQPEEEVIPAIATKSLLERMTTAFGILAFQFDIHPTILTIQVDMKDKPKIGKAVIGGFAISVGMFAITTMLASIKYGTGTHASLLETLPSSISLHFAALLVALQLGLSSAVSNSALYQHMEDCMGIQREFNHKRCMLRTTLSIVAILLAESVPRFDLVMALIGGTLTCPIVFILPPLFFIKILRLKSNHDRELQLETFSNIVYKAGIPSNVSYYMETKFTDDFGSRNRLEDMEIINIKCEQTFQNTVEIVFCTIIVLFGIMCTVTTTYLSISNTIEYATFATPCIYNLTFVKISGIF